MLLTYSVMALCVMVWYCSRRIAKAIENQNGSAELRIQQLAKAIENQSRSAKIFGTDSAELRTQLLAMHRVLLDSLKPDWWVKFQQMMGDFEKSQGVTEPDLLEGRLQRIKREREFIEEISKLPLHIVDQRLWDLIEEVRRDHQTASLIMFMIQKQGDSITEEERQLAKTLLNESEKTMERERHPACNEAHNIGQWDLVEWFHKHVISLSEERYYWNSKLRELIKPKIQPSASR